MNNTTKIKDKDLLKIKDKTDWQRVISENQDLSDNKSIQDSENPVLASSKFVKSQRK